MSMITRLNRFVSESARPAHEYPEFFYHGTNALFDSFTLDYMGRNFDQSILGLYFTQYVEPLPYGSTAKEYAEDAVMSNGGKPYIYKCRIRFRNPLVLDSNGWYSSNLCIDRQRNDIKRRMDHEKDYDCVVAYDFGEDEGIEFRDYILATSNLGIV